MRRPRLLTMLPANEWLLAIAADGSIAGSVPGDDASVVLGAAFDGLLQRPGATIVLVHNHPHGRSLSGADLEQLSKPGVSAIVAIGHDGSVYAASRGPWYDPQAFDARWYPLARREIMRGIRGVAASDRLRLPTVEADVEDLIGRALDKAHIIRYTALPSDGRRLTDLRAVALAGHIVESAAAQLRLTIQERTGGSPR